MRWHTGSSACSARAHSRDSQMPWTSGLRFAHCARTLRAAGAAFGVVVGAAVGRGAVATARGGTGVAARGFDSLSTAGDAASSGGVDVSVATEAGVSGGADVGAGAEAEAEAEADSGEVIV
jgi:hypothetical protein